AAELGEAVELGAQLPVELVPALRLVGHLSHQGRRRAHLFERPRGEVAESPRLRAQRVTLRHGWAELCAELGEERAGVLARRVLQPEGGEPRRSEDTRLNSSHVK